MLRKINDSSQSIFNQASHFLGRAARKERRECTWRRASPSCLALRACASFFTLVSCFLRLCLALSPCVWRFALVSRAPPLCFAFRVSLSRLALPPCVLRFALVFRASPLCLAFRACRLALPPCVSRFALVSDASRLFLAFRACLSFRPCVSRLAIAFLARLTELLLCRLESRDVTSILHAWFIPPPWYKAGMHLSLVRPKVKTFF